MSWNNNFKKIYKSTTLLELINTDFVLPGNEVLSVKYNGLQYSASLTKEGSIIFKNNLKTKEDKELVFKTLSAFAVYCYRLSNPTRKAVDGWSAVKHNGTLLSDIKNKYVQQIKGMSPYKSSKLSQKSTIQSNESLENEKNFQPKMKKLISKKKIEDSTEKLQCVEEQQTESETKDLMSTEDEQMNIKTVSTKRSTTSLDSKTLKKKKIEKRTKTNSNYIDPLGLVECYYFQEVDKHSFVKQPFKTIIKSNSLAVIEFHVHLTFKEVIGLLGGTYDDVKKELVVECSYPCKGLLTENDNVQVEMDPESELEVRERIKKENRIIVGWYHSHPEFRPDPSYRDIENQSNYQKYFTTDTESQPFIGLIASPYNGSDGSSELNCFWTYEDPESKNSLIPFEMSMKIDYVDDLSPVEVTDMKLISEYLQKNLIENQDNYKKYNQKLKCALESYLTKKETIEEVLSITSNFPYSVLK